MKKYEKPFILSLGNAKHLIAGGSSAGTESHRECFANAVGQIEGRTITRQGSHG